MSQPTDFLPLRRGKWQAYCQAVYATTGPMNGKPCTMYSVGPHFGIELCRAHLQAHSTQESRARNYQQLVNAMLDADRADFLAFGPITASVRDRRPDFAPEP